MQTNPPQIMAAVAVQSLPGRGNDHEIASGLEKLDFWRNRLLWH